MLGIVNPGMRQQKDDGEVPRPKPYLGLPEDGTQCPDLLVSEQHHSSALLASTPCATRPAHASTVSLIIRWDTKHLTQLGAAAGRVLTKLRPQ
jgi:hypothetical protein